MMKPFNKINIKNQNGAVLITALIMLILLTMLGLSSMTTTTMEERMAANSQEINRAFQAASSGLELVFSDEEAFNTSNTKALDGTANDNYFKSDTTIGGDATDPNAYSATANYNAVFLQQVSAPRGSGWDSTFAFYYFDLSASGSTASGASSTLHSGAYQVGKGS
jgi:type IV pilus assembly protein PilX